MAHTLYRVNIDCMRCGTKVKTWSNVNKVLCPDCKILSTKEAYDRRQVKRRAGVKVAQRSHRRGPCRNEQAKWKVVYCPNGEDGLPEYNRGAGFTLPDIRSTLGIANLERRPYFPVGIIFGKNGLRRAVDYKRERFVLVKV